MKYVLVINQQKLVEAAPDATLEEAAVMDVIYALCSSISAKIENSRITGPEGRRYTWLNYDLVLAELPLLRGKSKNVVVRIVKRLVELGFIVVFSPDHQRKYVAPTGKLEEIYRTVDNPVYRQGKSAGAITKSVQSHTEISTELSRNRDSFPPIEPKAIPKTVLIRNYNPNTRNQQKDDKYIYRDRTRRNRTGPDEGMQPIGKLLAEHPTRQS